MRRFLLLTLLLVALPLDGARATTLDPSHPLWRQGGPSQAEWMAALRELAGTYAHPLKRSVNAVARGRASATGRRVLVVPVLPADAGTPPRTQEQLAELWSGDGEGTVRGYWEYVSAGGLDLEIRVLPWLRVGGSLRDDYFNVLNGAPANLLAGPRRLATDALDAAAVLVQDLHVFDDDGPDGQPGSGDDDGILDLVVILHPFEGWETNPVDVPRAIVSLQTNLGRQPVGDSGLFADAFVVASARGPLGVWVHEFGHLLGLPDLYDLDRSPVPDTPGDLGPQGGLGRWSLMASGTWGGGGGLPSGLDAWSRSVLGFGEVLGFDSDASFALPWVDGTTATAAELSPLGPWVGERFLVEARRARGGGVVDGDLPGSGTLVYRLRPGLTANRIASKFLALLQADGRDDLSDGTNDGDATDPFDGSPGRDRVDETTDPSSASAEPDPAKTPPSLLLTALADGMAVDFALASGTALRLDALVIDDEAVPGRTWLRPAESARLLLACLDAGRDPAASATAEILADASGHPVLIEPAGPVAMEFVDGRWALADTVTVTDTGSGSATGVAQLRVLVSADGGAAREIAVGLPVRFRAGLAPDALARFTEVIHAAQSDTTRFARLPVGGLPGPAFLGYELTTNGTAGYADGVDVSLVSPWFAAPEDGLVWLWTRSNTEIALPGQAFDGAVVEVQVPDRGWTTLEPDGPVTTWIPRTSDAATRDRPGFGGPAPVWSASSVRLPDFGSPLRLRFRFASDASVSGGTLAVAGLETEGAPRAEIRLEERQGGQILALARLSGNFGRVNTVQYRYRESRDDPWKAASGVFTVTSGELLSLVLNALPDEVLRAEISLFSGSGAEAIRMGTAGLRRDPPARMPDLLRNPARGKLVLQSPDRSLPLSLAVFDVRGRLRARLVVPPRSPWVEWVPRDDRGNELPSGVYFMRAEGTDSAVVRFVWLR